MSRLSGARPWGASIITAATLALLASCVGTISGGASAGEPGPCGQATPAVGCGEWCSVDADCPLGLHCDAQACTASCSLGGDECGAGAVCDGRGNCLDQSAPVDDLNCPDVTVRTTRTRPVIQFVIDRSGSMSLPFGRTDRWNAMIDALVDPFEGVVTNLEGKVAFGASLYSQKATATTCPSLTTVARGLNTADVIAGLLLNNRPEGNTPTGEAILAAIDTFTAAPIAAGERPAIVLATDGEPDTCVSTDETAGRKASVAAAQRAARAGIPLYILSVGPEISQSHLQQMANAGAGLSPTGASKAPFFVASDPDDLTRELTSIVGAIRTCDIDLDANLDAGNASRGFVTLDGTGLTFGADWIQVDGNTIRLLGKYCDRLLESEEVEVRATFPCSAIVD